jgi:hypothetical protein
MPDTEEAVAEEAVVGEAVTENPAPETEIQEATPVTEVPIEPKPLIANVPTSAANWRGAGPASKVTELPSGNAVKIRKSVSLIGLLKAGRIPNPLMPVVRTMMKSTAPKDLEKVMDENFILQMNELIDLIVTLALVEPRCYAVPQPEKDESNEDYYIRLDNWQPPEGGISLLDLSEEDKQFIFSFIQSGVTEVEPFRQRRRQLMATTQNGDPLSEAAIGTDGNP